MARGVGFGEKACYKIASPLLEQEQEPQQELVSCSSANSTSCDELEHCELLYSGQGIQYQVEC